MDTTVGLTKTLLNEIDEVPEKLTSFKIQLVETRDYSGYIIYKYQIYTSNGILLNEFLPGNGYFYTTNKTEYGMFTASGTTVEVSIPFLLQDPKGAIYLAHELGHLNNPSDPKGLASYQVDASFGTNEYYIERFYKFLERVNLIWRTELEAWLIGKPIAIIIGVDETFFEDIMNKALQKYFNVYINELQKDILLLLSKGLISGNERIELYDIWSQEKILLIATDILNVKTNCVVWE